MENFQQLMVQNPAMQWMWNSVFISLVTMFLVCATSSLAGYVLAKNVSMGNVFSLQSLSLPWHFQNKLSLYHWYVSSTSWESMIPLGSYLAFDWMAIWGLPHETVQ